MNVILALGLSGVGLGLFLVWRFGERARYDGIGSFRLLPWAGLAYLAGVLLCATGLFLALMGLMA